MDKSLLIQKQIKDNAEDLHSYVRDLKLWEEEMKRKDRQLSNEATEEALPPVRRPKLTNKSTVKQEKKTEAPKKKLTSYDYSSWDKFDVEKACEDIDNEDNKNDDNEENSEEIAAQEEKYLKEKALYQKELGNKHVKASKWDEAIECYTRAIEAYPGDPVFFANRALCYLKKNKHELVEADSTAALKLDPTYVKAMLRRAAAREALDRLEDATYDLRNALKLEPNNSQALRDLERLKELGSKKKNNTVNRETKGKVISESTSNNKRSIQDNTQGTSLPHGSEGVKEDSPDVLVPEPEPEWEPCSNTVQPVVKPPHLRSKKSLKRIEIQDIGPNTPHLVRSRRTNKSENISTTQTPAPLATTSRVEVSVATAASTAKSRSILTIAAPVEDVPPAPTTSVQFHTAWSCVKADPDLRYRFLKQIPGESLPDIFKESLESRMFSSIMETLASEFTARDECVLGYLQGLARVKRFSTLALFMSAADKSNLVKLLDHCLRKGECSSGDVDELR